MSEAEVQRLEKMPVWLYERQAKSRGHLFVYSNFDHVLDQQVVEELRTSEAVAGHAAYNFYGVVAYDALEGMWYESVFTHQINVGNFRASTIESLIEAVLEAFGRE